MTGAMLFSGIFLGLAVLINFMFIVNKFKKGRHVDAVVDITVIMMASSLYGASIMGGVIATVGSMFISIYLHYVPLNLFANTEILEPTTPSTKGPPKPVPKDVGEEVVTPPVLIVLSKSWADKVDSLFK